MESTTTDTVSNTEITTTASTSIDLDTKVYMDKLEAINIANKRAIENCKNFFVLLDKIELSIKIKEKEHIDELIDINQSIDENIKIFKLICTNTQ